MQRGVKCKSAKIRQDHLKIFYSSSIDIGQNQDLKKHSLPSPKKGWGHNKGKLLLHVLIFDKSFKILLVKSHRPLKFEITLKLIDGDQITSPTLELHTFIMELTGKSLFVCLFVFVNDSHEQFFSYLATVTITGDRAANLDLCLALTAFSSEGSFTCHAYCDTLF
jgi:hypothetical protein